MAKSDIYDDTVSVPVRRETVAEFVARGGKIQVIPPRTAVGILRTFSARRMANTAPGPRERQRKAERKFSKNS